MLDLRGLNDAQREAVTFGDGALLVLAGPGSGKTFTITKRILYLMEERNVPPEQILVITFTREAASAMQQRFYQETGNQIYPVIFGTFHSIFYHIIRQAGLVRNPVFLQNNQKIALILPILKKLSAIQSEQKGESIAVSQEDAAAILSAISYYKNTNNVDKAVQRLPGIWETLFLPVYREYERVRRQRKVFDFDDMLCECERLLTEDTVAREYWQSRFSHILIDEFQDINYRQYRIISILAEKYKNLFVVGDDDQAIYGFRGSQPSCMRQFAEEYHAQKILLNINYRSHPDIVEASLQVIAENRDRFQKKLTACQEKILPEAGKEVSACQIHDFSERTEQYDYLAQMLSQKKETDTCAVLFRTNLYMQSFAAKLRSAGIPFVMKEKISSIYDHFVVKDIMAYLRIAAGEEDNELYVQILNRPSRYIGREAFYQRTDGKEKKIHRLLDYYKNSREEAIPDQLRLKICHALELLERQLSFLQGAEPRLAVSYVCKAIGYEGYLKKEAAKLQNRETKLQEWMELIAWLVEDASQYQSTQEWIEAQEAYREALLDRGSNGEKYFVAPGSIQLMTVHASKGLEFDRVWIPDCNEKIFPHGNLLDRESCEEERRIFYVAMTRAKRTLELLCLTGTNQHPRVPSRFLHSIRLSTHQIHSCPNTHQKHRQPFHKPHHPQ